MRRSCRKCGANLYPESRAVCSTCRDPMWALQWMRTGRGQVAYHVYIGRPSDLGEGA